MVARFAPCRRVRHRNPPARGLDPVPFRLVETPSRYVAGEETRAGRVHRRQARAADVRPAAAVRARRRRAADAHPERRDARSHRAHCALRSCLVPRARYGRRARLDARDGRRRGRPPGRLRGAARRTRSRCPCRRRWTDVRPLGSPRGRLLRQLVARRRTRRAAHQRGAPPTRCGARLRRRCTRSRPATAACRHRPGSSTTSPARAPGSAGRAPSACAPSPTPCRTIADGQHDADDLRRLERWLQEIPGRGACSYPDGVVRFAASALRVFGTEIDAPR